MEQEKRGVYAGAVGRFDFADDSMDTCIAIRTMVFKNGTAYLQAGGGIVFDSVEEDEYIETINKLGGNVRALQQAEGMIKLIWFDVYWYLSWKSIGMNSNKTNPAARHNRCSCIPNVELIPVNFSPW